MIIIEGTSLHPWKLKMGNCIAKPTPQLKRPKVPRSQCNQCNGVGVCISHHCCRDGCNGNCPSGSESYYHTEVVEEYDCSNCYPE